MKLIYWNLKRRILESVSLFFMESLFKHMGASSFETPAFSNKYTMKVSVTKR